MRFVLYFLLVGLLGLVIEGISGGILRGISYDVLIALYAFVFSAICLFYMTVQLKIITNKMEELSGLKESIAYHIDENTSELRDMKEKLDMDEFDVTNLLNRQLDKLEDIEDTIKFISDYDNIGKDHDHWPAYNALKDALINDKIDRDEYNKFIARLQQAKTQVDVESIMNELKRL